MNNLQIIEQREVLGREFKIYGDFENPLFLAKDVAEWIENTNVSQMLNVVDENEKALYTMYRVDGSTNKQWFLTEDGLYEVLMQSRKSIAKEFKKQVKIILKEIRKNGGYIATNENDTDEEIMAKALLVAQRTIQNKNEKIKALELDNQVKLQQIAELQPKATYYDLVLQCKDLLSVTVIAKDYGMSAKSFNKLLKDEKVQFKQGDIWLIYQKYADKGYTQTKTQNFSKTDGTQGTKPHMYWTQKGRLFLYDLLKNKGIVPMIEKEIFLEM